MNKLLHIVFVSALLAVSYSEVSARSPTILSGAHKGPYGIVNGTDAAEGEFPYLVQLRGGTKKFFGGGTIIGDKWILTIAQFLNYDIDSIVFGTNNLVESEDTANVIKVKQVYAHPKFTYTPTLVGLIPVYDVGIIELAEAIPFSDKAQPIKLANSSENVPFGVDGVLAGWGLNESTSVVAQPSLQKVVLKLLNDTECAQKLAAFVGVTVFDPIHNLCSDDVFKGECNGDFGGPFVINGTQYGIGSWSFIPCGGSPGSYSRLTNPEYRDFIRNVTGV